MTYHQHMTQPPWQHHLDHIIIYDDGYDTTQFHEWHVYRQCTCPKHKDPHHEWISTNSTCISFTSPMPTGTTFISSSSQCYYHGYDTNIYYNVNRKGSHMHKDPDYDIHNHPFIHITYRRTQYQHDNTIIQYLNCSPPIPISFSIPFAFILTPILVKLILTCCFHSSILILVEPTYHTSSHSLSDAGVMLSGRRGH